jgi:hypothetical protein
MIRKFQIVSFVPSLYYWYNKKQIPRWGEFFFLASKKRYVIYETTRFIRPLLFELEQGLTMHWVADLITELVNGELIG